MININQGPAHPVQVPTTILQQTATITETENGFKQMRLRDPPQEILSETLPPDRPLWQEVTTPLQDPIKTPN